MRKQTAPRNHRHASSCHPSGLTALGPNPQQSATAECDLDSLSHRTDGASAAGGKPRRYELDGPPRAGAPTWPGASHRSARQLHALVRPCRVRELRPPRRRGLPRVHGAPGA